MNIMVTLNKLKRKNNIISAEYYPEDDKLYQNHFERNGYFQNMPYIIKIRIFAAKGGFQS